MSRLSHFGVCSRKYASTWARDTFSFRSLTATILPLSLLLFCLFRLLFLLHPDRINGAWPGTELLLYNDAATVPRCPFWMIHHYSAFPPTFGCTSLHTFSRRQRLPSLPYRRHVDTFCAWSTSTHGRRSFRSGMGLSAQVTWTRTTNGVGLICRALKDPGTLLWADRHGGSRVATPHCSKSPGPRQLFVRDRLTSLSRLHRRKSQAVAGRAADDLGPTLPSPPSLPGPSTSSWGYGPNSSSTIPEDQPQRK